MDDAMDIFVSEYDEPSEGNEWCGLLHYRADLEAVADTHKDLWTHLREVKPGTITLTRDEFRTLKKDIFDTSFDEVEEALFGKED